MLDTDKTIENESGIEEIEIEEEKVKKSEDLNGFMKNKKKIIIPNEEKMSEGISSTSSSSESEISEKSEDLESRPEGKTTEEYNHLEDQKETTVSSGGEEASNMDTNTVEDKVEDMKEDETFKSEHS